MQGWLWGGGGVTERGRGLGMRWEWPGAVGRSLPQGLGRVELEGLLLKTNGGCKPFPSLRFRPASPE